MDKTKLKEALYSFGKLLSVVSIAFIFYKIYQEYSISSFYSKMLAFKGIILYLIALNVVSLLTGIYVWLNILRQYSPREFGYLTAFYYFAKTEVAKYLPGNIFHLVGRQALASRLGIKHSQMAKITLFHTIVLLFGTVISATILALFTQEIESYYKLAAIVISMALCLLLCKIYPVFSKKKKVILLLMIAFSIAMQGFMLAWIVAYQSQDYSMDKIFLVASIYVISWIIGFVTPGASGGLGVREGAFIAIVSFLHIDIADDVVIFSIIFVRFINILVDLLLYVVTLFLKRYELQE